MAHSVSCDNRLLEYLTINTLRIRVKYKICRELHTSLNRVDRSCVDKLTNIEIQPPAPGRTVVWRNSPGGSPVGEDRVVKPLGITRYRSSNLERCSNLQVGLNIA